MSCEGVRVMAGVGVIERPGPRVLPDGVLAWDMVGVGVVDPSALKDDPRLWDTLGAAAAVARC